MEQLQIDGGLIYSLKNGANHDEINVTMVDGSRSNDMREAGARRVLACVNACAGMEKPEEHIQHIESASAFHYKQAMKNGEIASKYKSERDELLAALKAMVGNTEADSDESEAAHRQARSAITKAEGLQE